MRWRLRLFHLRRLPGGLVLAEARSPLARLLGLALLKSLPADQAVLIPRCRSVHTFGMRFDLDVLFLSADRVLRVAPRVPPGRVLRCPGATAVIETRAGAGDRYLEALGLRR